MAAADTDLYRQIAEYLDSISQQHNFQVAKTAPIGKPASDGSGGREFRMQLINSGNDTSEKFKESLPKLLARNKTIRSVKFNELSPNSSKYSSVSFKIDNASFDIVIAKGSNKGENFEKKVVGDLAGYFAKSGVNSDYAGLVKQLTAANKQFAKHEIKEVKQRTGSTKKEGVAIEKLGEIIGDIVLTDSANKKWFISLKDVNGDTFSSYSGAATLMSNDGELDPKSDGAAFLKAFGVDLNQVQAGYDVRGNKKKIRKKVPVSRASSAEIKNIFERAWGMNYFYVRKASGSQWKVFWIGREQLDNLSSNIKVTSIKYPDKSSKQITILCSNAYADYSIEVRNSKGGEYPNDIKFKVKKVNIK